MKLDHDKQRQLGLDGGHMALSSAVMRYAAGVVTRERERLARIFESHGMKEVAQAVRDTSLDDNVFKWNGPEQDLDVSPKSVEQREREKGTDD